MNWDDLRFVLATARARTLSGAAQELGVTHTTVARRLRALEERIGARVFDARAEGLVPTAAGERLRDAAERMEEEVMGLDRAIVGRDARLTGPLCVATTDLLVLWFPELWASFAKEYPGIDLEVAASTRVANLTKRDADVAIRFTNRPPENLVGRKVGRLDYAVYGARSLVGSRRRVQLDAYPWIAWSERAQAKLTWAWMRKHVPGARIAMTVDAAVVFYAALRAGMGLGHLPCIEGDGDPTLRRLGDPIEGFGMDIWVLTHPDLRNTARIRAFMQHAATCITARADDLAG
ncbi:MAG: LysR family transcriptional regulator [Myxococcales bacterium]|nr:LysR family transcriptional regulator [Myxococcales bacterium]